MAQRFFSKYGMASSNPFFDYWFDAAQRSVQFWDVMRLRGNQYLDHAAETVPNVLEFEFEIVMDGASLPRPVNYGLVRITPPEGVETNTKKPPYVVIDPRAGHGPGIGGFKADSEIGFALRAGHPYYFIGFLPEPLAGQAIEDVMMAEVAFVERVIELHPDAAGKPVVIGNCQAGWAVMILASYRPDLIGALIIAGGPLTYWAGKHGENPLRYSGGWLGGAWLTRLSSDVGNGTFDGAWLVSNFEGMNPANTLWSKQYNLYSKVDTEGPRYLGFEKWWGGHVVLNGEEMQFIVDNLFVGNTLPTGGVTTTDGVALDYRNINAPIVCFSVLWPTTSRRPSKLWGGLWTFMKMWTTSAPTTKLLSMPSTKASATWGFLSRAESRARNSANSSRTWTSLMSCRRGSTRRCWRIRQLIRSMPTCHQPTTSPVSSRGHWTSSGR